MTQYTETSTVEKPEEDQKGRQGSQERALAHGYQLVSDAGKTAIGDTVVAKIAAISTREISGIHQLNARGAGGMVSGLAARVTGGDSQSAGVGVEVGEREAAIDLAVTMNYGVNIPQVSEAVRRNVINRVQSMTGLVVKEVNIDVQDLFFEEEEARKQASERRVE